MIYLNQTPNDLIPAGNPIMYEFESDKTNEVNFRFKVEIIKDNLTLGIVVVYPELGNRAHFDCSEIVSRTLPDPELRSEIYSRNNGTAKVRVRVTEQYGDPIVDHINILSPEIRVFNATLENELWEQFDGNDWKGNMYLTDNVEETRYISREIGTVPISLIIDEPFQIDIRGYDSNGTLISYATIQEPDPTFVIVDINLNRFNLADYNIDAFDIAYFTFVINDAPTLTFIYQDECMDNRVNLCWLNKYGAFESFNFPHSLSRSTTVSTKHTERSYGRWKNGQFRYDHTESGLRDYLKIMEDDLIVTTKWLDMFTANWLKKSILESPLIYFFTGLYLANRVLVDENKIELIDRYHDDLISVSIKLKQNNKRLSINL